MNDIEIVKNTVSTREDDLIARVIESGNIEGLERVIALREREEARQAALMFDRAFATMKAEMPVIRKETQGHGYKYASLEAIQALCDPVISKHGFSYSWHEETTEIGKKETMTIYGCGHSRSNSIESALISGTNRMNAVQVVGATNTYLRRYTFISGFGINVVGEDFDGVPQADPAQYAGDVASLESCQTKDELISCWGTIYQKHSGNAYARLALAQVKDRMKERFE